jgi:thiamine biosynthesis protein ThiS
VGEKILPSEVGAEMKGSVTANGNLTEIVFPCSLETFLLRQELLPKSVVVELNGEAVAPSEFGEQALGNGDRLEIVRIVAGG